MSITKAIREHGAKAGRTPVPRQPLGEKKPVQAKRPYPGLRQGGVAWNMGGNGDKGKGDEKDREFTRSYSGVSCVLTFYPAAPVPRSLAVYSVWETWYNPLCRHREP